MFSPRSNYVSNPPIHASWRRAAMQAMAVDFMGNSADAIVAAMPAAERRRLTQGGHMVDPAVLAPVLATWFAS